MSKEVFTNTTSDELRSSSVEAETSLMLKKQSLSLTLFVIFLDPAANEDESALDWWRCNAVTFPKCAHIARKYLAIPATSAQSECLFSATGRLISKTRSRLLPENADCVIFLNKNNDMFASAE